MNKVQDEFLDRAQDALAMARGLGRVDGNEGKTKAFAQLAAEIAMDAGQGNLPSRLRAHKNPMVAKAAASMLAGWGGHDAESMAAAFVASIAEFSILDSIAKYARVLPPLLPRAMIASGFTANATAEGTPKVVKQLQVTLDPAELTKVVALVVATRELLDGTGSAGLALFQGELERAVIRGMNQAALAALPTSSASVLPSSGDPLADLRAGLAAAEPSYGYVVAAPTADVAQLATQVEAGPGFAVRGGEFRPGVHVVASDTVTGMTIIPASRLALHLGPLELRASGLATVDMQDSPSSPSEQVSLWQTNSSGLICERQFKIVADSVVCVRVEQSP